MNRRPTDRSGPQTSGVPGRSDYDGPLPALGGAIPDGNSGTGVLGVDPIASVHATPVFSTQDVNGLLIGTKWSVKTLTYSFPTKSSEYGASHGTGVGQYPDNAPFNNLSAFSAAQRAVARYAFGLISQYTPLKFKQITETDTTHATIRMANSAEPSTSYAYYPDAGVTGGDAFFGNVADVTPKKGNYSFYSILHELGHTLGLKHGQEQNGAFGVLPVNHDSGAWSLMDYHSYVGGDLFYRNADGSGNQTYMSDDISALQYLYGANFKANGGNTVYSWEPDHGEMSINSAGQGAAVANKIYEALWDGNGVDTYDLHAYSAKLQIDLRPGYWSTFDPAQVADIPDGTGTIQHPPGELANANLYKGDLRSLIGNAIGGAGADEITGNQADNALTGNAGADKLAGGGGGDRLDGGAGNDTLNGGSGNDTAVYAGAGAGVTVSLTVTGVQDTVGAGKDTLISIENLSGTSFGDTLTGDADANVILGGNGADTLLGGGADKLQGGQGADTLTGGSGDATFVYRATGESQATAADLITDFHAGDRIDLSAIDADSVKNGHQSFHLGATAGHVGDVVVQYDAAHKRTSVSLFTNADATADAVIWLKGDHHGLTAGDFSGVTPPATQSGRESSRLVEAMASLSVSPGGALPVAQARTEPRAWLASPRSGL